MKKLIFIVDDDPEILDIMMETLEINSEYQVKGFSTGQSVIEFVKEKGNVPDLFVLDIWLPDIDGDEIAILLREAPATKAIPILLISAIMDVKLLANEIGVDDYLSKPFQIDEFEYKINSLLNQKGVSN